MKLYTREWGTGDRLAILVHGVMSDSRNWRRVGPVLAERGYHVIAIDLRGHGHSPRAEEYSAELMAQDIVDTVPALITPGEIVALIELEVGRGGVEEQQVHFQIEQVGGGVVDLTAQLGLNAQ